MNKYAHLTAEDTEAEGSVAICPRSHIGGCQSGDLILGSLALKAAFLTITSPEEEEEG